MNKGFIQTTKSMIAVMGLGLALGLTGCAEKRFEAYQNPSTPGATDTDDPTSSPTPTPTPTPPGSTPTPTPTPPGSTPTPTPTPPGATPTPTPTPPPGCTTEVVESIYLKTKLLFVVDTSGSNKNASLNSKREVIMPTDPDKESGFRASVLRDFTDRFRHKTNFNWGMTTFSNGASTALINQNSNLQLPIFANSPGYMDTALTAFRYQADTGDTPYGKALALAAKAIANDPDKNKTGYDSPTYFVIFVTDGFPTDYYKDVDSNGDGKIDEKDDEWEFQESQMNTDLNNLLAAAPGKVNLSTIFYGQKNDPVAISLLQNMASRGGGQFANVNVTTSNFKIEDVIPGSETCK